MVPTQNSIDMQEKLGNNSVLTGDTCPTAQKTSCLPEVHIYGKVIVSHFMHNMCNVWMGGVETAVKLESNKVLLDGLEEIALHYCL